MPWISIGAAGRPRRPFQAAIVALAALCCPGCLFIVSTGPTTVEGGTVVFVVVDGDRRVDAAQVDVRDTVGSWSSRGITADGEFRCQLDPAVTEILVTVSLPADFEFVDEGWPRQIEVAAATVVDVEIRVRRRA
jgi:hypothetical protein